MDWDDLRFVLAVTRAGSAQQAARALGVNQTTVTRRIARIEQSLDAELFERRQAGYFATPAGEAAARMAESIEQAVSELEHSLAAERRVLAGTVRFTTSETLANGVIAPNLAEFRRIHPAIAVQVIVEDRTLNIAGGEADVALRAGDPPQHGGVVFRRMPETNWGLYCSPAYARDRGMPRNREEIAQHALVGMAGPMAQVAPVNWVEDASHESAIAMRCTSLTSLVPNLRAGLGIGALPCLIGDRDAELVRCFALPATISPRLWLIVREELKSTPHVRAFVDHIAARLQAMRPILAGTGTAPSAAEPGP